MLWTPRGLGGFGFSLSSTTTTRITAAWGTTVVPGASNTKGSYAAVIAAGSILVDCYLLQVNFNNSATSAAARDILADIGVDPAGGSSFTVLIPDLLASCAAPAVGAFGSGISYLFPIFVRKGSSLACRAAVNNVTGSVLSCRIQLWGAPRDSRAMRVGSKVIAYGITAASSSGTAVTSGTTSEGAWTQIGTIASGDRPWYWQLGMGCNDATMSAVAYTCDLSVGNASSKEIVLEERVYQATAAEQLSDGGIVEGMYAAAPADLVYGRIQCSGTADSALSLAAYGVI